MCTAHDTGSADIIENVTCILQVVHSQFRSIPGIAQIKLRFMSHSPQEAPRSGCPIANVLDIVGDRWTLLVIRDLLLYNKHEYKEFIASPEAIATNILSDRLKRLTCAGLVDEISHPANKSRKLYYLTPSGKALLPVLIEIARWGAAHLTIQMPKHVKAKIKTDPQIFATETLQALEDWEVEHLPAAILRQSRRRTPALPRYQM